MSRHSARASRRDVFVGDPDGLLRTRDKRQNRQGFQNFLTSKGLGEFNRCLRLEPKSGPPCGLRMSLQSDFYLAIARQATITSPAHDGIQLY
jgi:hypothetical protein